MVLTKNQIIIGVGVAVVFVAVIITGIVLSRSKKSANPATPTLAPTLAPTPPPTKPPRCKNADKCNETMYEWIVKNNWAFEDTRNNWKDICGDCETVWYKRAKDPDPNKKDFTSYTSKDGKNWKAHKDAISAYEDVKV